MKKYWLSVFVILVAFVLLDYLVHCVILMRAYQDTALLWRAAEDMNIYLVNLPTLIVVLCFVGIYHRLITRKNFRSALHFATLWGIAGGTSMGLGCYGVMPIPASMALTWFVAILVEAIIGGAILGWIYGNQGDGNSNA